MSGDDANEDEAIREAMAAALHVHTRLDGDADVSISRDNVAISVMLTRDEIAVLIMALRTKLEFVSIRAGEVTVTVSSDWTEEEGRSPGFDDLSTIGIEFRGSDPILAIRDRETLIALLRDGCSTMGAPTRASERPGDSKCN
jgi:hypothetical protein